MTTPIPTQSAADRVAREDLVLFINACFASTGQSEFYGDSAGQGVSIRFLHEYILVECSAKSDGEKLEMGCAGTS